jgi:hypothetical protein
MSETVNIAAIASKVAADVFLPFKWELVGPADENFPCHKERKHRVGDVVRQHPTHPVDCVFKYFDPYLNKNIYLLTDLKSYKKESINYNQVKDALNSLGRAIECAQTSTEWHQKYVLDDAPFEVRGMLYIYNHDDRYDKDLLAEVKSKIKLEDLEIAENQQLHLVTPSTIVYLRSVVQDISELHMKREFPRTNYSFYYPDLTLHKASGDPEKHSGIIEALCAPFMVMKFSGYVSHEQGEADISVGDGHVVFYSLPGETEYEFIYLLDYLSTWQILNGKGSIKIRVVCGVPSSNLISNFRKAQKLYLKDWGEDESRKRNLDRIEIEPVNMTIPNYVPSIAGWRIG